MLCNFSVHRSKNSYSNVSFIGFSVTKGQCHNLWKQPPTSRQSYINRRPEWTLLSSPHPSENVRLWMNVAKLVAGFIWAKYSDYELMNFAKPVSEKTVTLMSSNVIETHNTWSHRRTTAKGISLCFSSLSPISAFFTETVFFSMFLFFTHFCFIDKDESDGKLTLGPHLDNCQCWHWANECENPVRQLVHVKTKTS